MKFDTFSQTLRGRQKWRFNVDDHSKNHYIEITESYTTFDSDKLMSKYICLRMDDQQLSLMKEMLDEHFSPVAPQEEAN
tara:strand:- start:156 stop:392 length:237 start_codon:yes stop_codon:yes gene_type:complete